MQAKIKKVSWRYENYNAFFLNSYFHVIVLYRSKLNKPLLSQIVHLNKTEASLFLWKSFISFYFYVFQQILWCILLIVTIWKPNLLSYTYLDTGNVQIRSHVCFHVIWMIQTYRLEVQSYSVVTSKLIMFFTFEGWCLSNDRGFPLTAENWKNSLYVENLSFDLVAIFKYIPNTF